METKPVSVSLLVSSIPISISLVSIGFCFFVIFRFFHGKQPLRNLPPGSIGLPLLGETLALLKPHRSNSLGEFLQQRFTRFGRIFKSHLFGSPAIVSCDYELNMFILQNEDKLFQACYPKAMHGILGRYSLLVVSGDLHKKLRNVVVNFATSFKSTSAFLRLVEKLSISKIESWKDQTQVPICKEAKEIALNLIVKLLLSIKPGEPEAYKILEDFQTYMKGFISLPIYFPGTAYANAVKARARLSSTVGRKIKERKMRKNGVEEEEEDYLDVILRKGGLVDEEIVSIVLDILLGGYETTSTLISLILYFLGHAPLAFQTLREEHLSIRRNKKDGELLSWDDYHKMNFTYNVIYEAMRCGNVVKFLHRKALKDVQYKGYIIPSGWKVLPVFTAVHLDPSVHPDPMEFNPWRWTDKSMYKKVMPFGGGTRLCPGAEVAKVEISIFLHHLVLNYRWKIKADDYPVAYPFVEFTKGLVAEIEKIKHNDDCQIK